MDRSLEETKLDGPDIEKREIIESRCEKSKVNVEKDILKCKTLCQYFADSCKDFESALGLNVNTDVSTNESSILIDDNSQQGGELGKDLLSYLDDAEKTYVGGSDTEAISRNTWADNCQGDFERQQKPSQTNSDPSIMVNRSMQTTPQDEKLYQAMKNSEDIWQPSFGSGRSSPYMADVSSDTGEQSSFSCISCSDIDNTVYPQSPFEMTGMEENTIDVSKDLNQSCRDETKSSLLIKSLKNQMKRTLDKQSYSCHLDFSESTIREDRKKVGELYTGGEMSVNVTLEESVIPSMSYLASNNTFHFDGLSEEETEKGHSTGDGAGPSPVNRESASTANDIRNNSCATASYDSEIDVATSFVDLGNEENLNNTEEIGTNCEEAKEDMFDESILKDYVVIGKETDQDVTLRNEEQEKNEEQIATEEVQSKTNKALEEETSNALKEHCSEMLQELPNESIPSDGDHEFDDLKPKQGLKQDVLCLDETIRKTDDIMKSGKTVIDKEDGEFADNREGKDAVNLNIKRRRRRKRPRLNMPRFIHRNQCNKITNFQDILEDKKSSENGKLNQADALSTFRREPLSCSIKKARDSVWRKSWNKPDHLNADKYSARNRSPLFLPIAAPDFLTKSVETTPYNTAVPSVAQQKDCFVVMETCVFTPDVISSTNKKFRAKNAAKDIQKMKNKVLEGFAKANENDDDSIVACYEKNLSEDVLLENDESRKRKSELSNLSLKRSLRRAVIHSTNKRPIDKDCPKVNGKSQRKNNSSKLALSVNRKETRSNTKEAAKNARRTVKGPSGSRVAEDRKQAAKNVKRKIREVTSTKSQVADKSVNNVAKEKEISIAPASRRFRKNDVVVEVQSSLSPPQASKRPLRSRKEVAKVENEKPVRKVKSCHVRKAKEKVTRQETLSRMVKKALNSSCGDSSKLRNDSCKWKLRKGRRMEEANENDVHLDSKGEEIGSDEGFAANRETKNPKRRHVKTSRRLNRKKRGAAVDSKFIKNGKELENKKDKSECDDHQKSTTDIDNCLRKTASKKDGKKKKDVEELSLNCGTVSRTTRTRRCRKAQSDNSENDDGKTIIETDGSHRLLDQPSSKRTLRGKKEKDPKSATKVSEQQIANDKDENKMSIKDEETSNTNNDGTDAVCVGDAVNNCASASPYAASNALTIGSSASSYAAINAVNNCASASPHAASNALTNVASASPYAACNAVNNCASASPHAASNAVNNCASASPHTANNALTNVASASPYAASNAVNNSASASPHAASNALTNVASASPYVANDALTSTPITSASEGIFMEQIDSCEKDKRAPGMDNFNHIPKKIFSPRANEDKEEVQVPIEELKNDEIVSDQVKGPEPEKEDFAAQVSKNGRKSRRNNINMKNGKSGSKRVAQTKNGTASKIADVEKLEIGNHDNGDITGAQVEGPESMTEKIQTDNPSKEDASKTSEAEENKQKKRGHRKQFAITSEKKNSPEATKEEVKCILPTEIRKKDLTVIDESLKQDLNIPGQSSSQNSKTSEPMFSEKSSSQDSKLPKKSNDNSMLSKKIDSCTEKSSAADASKAKQRKVKQFDATTVDEGVCTADADNENTDVGAVRRSTRKVKKAQNFQPNKENIVEEQIKQIASGKKQSVTKREVTNKMDESRIPPKKRRTLFNKKNQSIMSIGLSVLQETTMNTMNTTTHRVSSANTSVMPEKLHNFLRSFVAPKLKKKSS